MKAKSILGVVALLTATTLSVSFAQNGPPTPQQQAERAVKTRQGLFDVQGFAFGPVAAMLKDAPFDAATAQKAAVRLQVTASMIPEVFKLDTRKFTVTTKAKDAVWTDSADFSKKADDLLKAAMDLEAAAKKGDRTASLAAATAAGQACKSCHETFREK